MTDWANQIRGSIKTATRPNASTGHLGPARVRENFELCASYVSIRITSHHELIMCNSFCHLCSQDWLCLIWLVYDYTCDLWTHLLQLFLLRHSVVSWERMPEEPLTVNECDAPDPDLPGTLATDEARLLKLVFLVLLFSIFDRGFSVQLWSFNKNMALKKI